MNQKELRHIRQAFNARYAQKRDWPMRVDKPRVEPLPHPIAREEDVAAGPSPPPSPVAKSTYERVSFVLRDAINDGFAFTFDRIGNGMVVMSVDKTRRPITLSVGSLLVAINGQTVRLEDDVQPILNSRNPKLSSPEQKEEAIRLQMINLFKAHGVSAKSPTPCNATFVQTPPKVQAVQKWNPRSTYKPWSHLCLKLHCGYLNFYTSQAKAESATVEDMHTSGVAINVVYCVARPVADGPEGQRRGSCFEVIEIPRPPFEPDAVDSVDSPSPDDSGNEATKDSNPAIETDADSSLLEEMHDFLGSKSVVEKVVVQKEPRLYRFRVETAAARASWLRHIHAAQTFCAEDFDQP